MHPADRPVVQALDLRPEGHREASTALQLHRLSEPVAGPCRSLILLLLLKARSKGTEPRVEAGDPAIFQFRRAMLGHDVPHIHSGAYVGRAAGSVWWRRRTIGPLLKKAEHSQRAFAAKLDVVQSFSYALRKWGHGHGRLPTQAYAFRRVAQALATGAHVVVRGLDLRAGALPSLLAPVFRERVYAFRSSRSTSLSPRNLAAVFPDDGPSPFERISAALLAP